MKIFQILSLVLNLKKIGRLEREQQREVRKVIRVVSSDYPP